MGAPTIGHVKLPSGKRIAVAWDQYSREVYVHWAGWSYVGHAGSAREAMTKAEAWLYDK